MIARKAVATIEAKKHLSDKGKPHRKGGTQSRQSNFFSQKEMTVRLPKASQDYPLGDQTLVEIKDLLGGYVYVLQ
jgi:hypothetical protein